MNEPDSDALQDDAPSTSGSAGSGTPKPVCIIVIGMAGSGKTTLIQRINSHLHTRKLPGYIINLDPAVSHLPYGANIDIRDTVKYKEVMKQYGLGPNGGILTSCNLFATRFDQVIQLLEKQRDPPLRYVVTDTPGQIEIFTWSASGQIVTELMASSFPTVVVYVADTPRCAAPQAFMSNMLQAVSILYKTRLPLLLAFNKVDVQRHDFALEWMRDFDAYAAALEADSSYAATLSRSLSLVLDEFYGGIKSVGVSALSGEGMDEFFQAVESCASDYKQFYLPELEAKRQARLHQEGQRQAVDMERLRTDMAGTSINGGGAGGAAAGPAARARVPGGEGVREEDDRSVDLQLSDDSIEESAEER